jgi:hypothetical protein
MNQPLRRLTISVAAIAAVAVIAWHARPGDSAPRPRAPNDVTIVTRDFAFDAPDSIPAGITTIHVENHGPNLHQVAIIRLDSGHTVEDFRAALERKGSWPTWVTYLGGPTTTVPGTVATATVHLPPGQYMIACLVHALDDVSHAMESHTRGMIRPLTVTGVDGPATLPRADVMLTLANYGFSLSQPLMPGKHVIRVRNTAPQPHEVQLVRLPPGTTIADIPRWITTRTGPLPGTLVGGLTPITRGLEANIVVDLEPGEYGLICFLPDAHDGQPNFTHGMMRQITVGGLLARRLP